MRIDWTFRTVDNSIHIRLPTMPREVEVVSSEDEVVTVLVQEVAAMVVAGVVVTSPRSHEINSHHANCVEGQITQSLSATRDLIQIIWEKKKMRMQQHLME
jgi:hypothetical protein